MIREQLIQKIEEICDKYSGLGEITDIWIHPDLLDILDARNPMDRVLSPLKLNGVYVTPFSPLQKTQVRIAFLSEDDFELFEDEKVTDEPISTSGSPSSSHQTDG